MLIGRAAIHFILFLCIADYTVTNSYFVMFVVITVFFKCYITLHDCEVKSKI